VRKLEERRKRKMLGPVVSGAGKPIVQMEEEQLKEE
jgi:hypothetical protein